MRITHHVIYANIKMRLAYEIIDIAWVYMDIEGDRKNFSL